MSQHHPQYSMEDRANIIVFNPMNSFDEKPSFENEVTPTWTPSGSASRFLSEKLSSWGVEARGAYRILMMKPDRT
jgi:hypothetical protein